jgi:glyoxylate reductase
VTSRVFLTRRIPDAGIDLLKDAEVDLRIGQADANEPVTRDILEAGFRWGDGAITLLTETIDESLLGMSDQLRGIANYAVGFNNIDLKAATAFGIPVANTPGVLTESTADFTWALLMAVSRRVVEGDAFMRGNNFRQWGPSLLLGHDIGPGPDGKRKTLGIIGFGRIGQAVARRASGFQMEVLAFDPPARKAGVSYPGVCWCELDDLLRRSDFVTLHPSLTEDTRHLVSSRELRMMKASAFLVNVARGPVVDEGALVHALSSGWIAGAALDVYENEPEMADGLSHLPNVVVAPHIASATVDTRNRMAVMAATNMLAFLRGEEGPNTVNRSVYQSGVYLARRRP